MKKFSYHPGARWIDCARINKDSCDKCGWISATRQRRVFGGLHTETQQEIMQELTNINQLSAHYSDLAAIQAAADEWIKQNNTPKTPEEWRAAVLARNSFSKNRIIIEFS